MIKAKKKKKIRLQVQNDSETRIKSNKTRKLGTAQTFKQENHIFRFTCQT